MNNWNIRIWEYEFIAPMWLWLLLIVPIYLVIAFRSERTGRGAWKFTGSSTDQRSFSTSWIPRVRQLILILQSIALSLLLVAMAKPYRPADFEDIDENYKQGIDIILAMDVSLSMMAMDFKPNRLAVAKDVAKEFVNGRKGDRIGLVVYAGEAYTACPATLDYTILKEQIDRISGENIESGTAIGTGLGTAVSRLRSDSIPSKVVILLTDGSNNSGEIDPITAAELAKAKNIRVYTIGVGSDGIASTPVVTPFGVRYEQLEVEIDEMTLMKIATITNGKFFRATDEKSLKAIYEEIDQLEKRKMLDQQYKTEPPTNPSAFLNWSILLLMISFISLRTLFPRND
jgi:Ca-activated chloride channel family protein